MSTLIAPVETAKSGAAGSAFEITASGTTSALGREIRLRRLFGADGRTCTVALDQAVPRGVAPQACLDDRDLCDGRPGRA